MLATLLSAGERIGVTGLPPNDYIRLVRLKVAAELLQSGKSDEITILPLDKDTLN